MLLLKSILHLLEFCLFYILNRKYFTLVTPETVLYRWKRAIKDYWTYDKPNTRKKGRLPITKSMKLLIKKLKVENYLWGCKRIQDELEKISINIDRIKAFIPFRKTDLQMFQVRLRRCQYYLASITTITEPLDLIRKTFIICHGRSLS